MKFLFIGLGSVGQRHLQNLLRLFPGAKIYALRKKRSSLFIKDGKASNVGSLAQHYGISEISSYKQAVNLRPDVSFITNPTSMHASAALKMAKAGSHVFIEKPVSHTMGGAKKLLAVLCKKKLLSYVGYQTRFHPIVREIEKIMSKKKPKLVSAAFVWGTYLPFHHKYEDYSKSYAARKELGGGVELNLIHEIDLIIHFFSMPRRVFAAGGKLSNLKMSAHDTAMALLDYGKFHVSLKLSYAQVREERRITLQFTDSLVIADLAANVLEVFGADGRLARRFAPRVARNDLFTSELSYFLDCIKKRKRAKPDVEQAMKSLQVALEIRKKIDSRK